MPLEALASIFAHGQADEEEVAHLKTELPANVIEIEATVMFDDA